MKLTQLKKTAARFETRLAALEKEAQNRLADLEEPFATTKKIALLGGLTIFLGGIVIGFLSAPARTKTMNFGTNNVYKAPNEDAVPEAEEDEEKEDEDEEDENEEDEED